MSKIFTPIKLPSTMGYMEAKIAKDKAAMAEAEKEAESKEVSQEDANLKDEAKQMLVADLERKKKESKISKNAA